MISKLRFSLIAFMMLVLVGFGFQDQAKGQIGLDGLFCPAVPDTTGWLETIIDSPGAVAPDFTGSLIGTVEASGADAVGGLDWQHVDMTEFRTPTPTNEVGSQLVSWWTQKNGRNTYLQVTNTSFTQSVTVHVRIHNEDCAEIRDFCDTYTPSDTHEYNFSDLVTNGGATPGDANLQGNEGWLVVTAVENCSASDELPENFNYLAGQLIVHDSDDYLYGVNTYARQAICDDETIEVPVNRVANGSFQDGEDNWDETQGFAEVIEPSAISDPPVLPSNPYDSNNAAFVVSNDSLHSGANNYNCGSLTEVDGLGVCPVANITDQGGTDVEVSVWESDTFTVLSTDPGTAVTGNLQVYTQQQSTCDSWQAVFLISLNGDGTGDLESFVCYQDENAGQFQINGQNCIQLEDSDDDISFLDAEFSGRTGFQAFSLNTAGPGDYIIQVATGLNSSGTCEDDVEAVGALVNNFQFDGENIFDIGCDGRGPLTGAPNARLDRILPDFLAGQFNILPGNLQAGADVVHINFADDYNGGEGPYRPIAAFSNVNVSIFDEFEVDQSCGETTVCFVRLGIDDALVMSEDFVLPTPTPTPPPPTTIPPTTAPPTITPPPATPTPGGGGNSSSCAIAGSPVQLGTALANVLIPLVPVAFAFGVRAARRRKK